MNSVIKTFENHQNHQSVQEIEVANSDETKTFDFSHLAKEKIGNEILNISSQKSTSEGDIPKKELKESINVYNRKLTTIINSCLEEDYSLMNFKKHEDLIQSAFTCSKLTIETLEQGVKYVQS